MAGWVTRINGAAIRNHRQMRADLDVLGFAADPDVEVENVQQIRTSEPARSGNSTLSAASIWAPGPT